MDYTTALKQYTDTYLDKQECTGLLTHRWPALFALLPEDWWYPESPLRQWLNYSRHPTYERALTLFQEELVCIADRFPNHFRHWIGSIAVSQQFWAKRFESMAVYRLISSGLDVVALDVKSASSNNDIDIMVRDNIETVYVECTSARKPPNESEEQTVRLHAFDYLIARFREIPGSYVIDCNIMPDLMDKKSVDGFVQIFSDFISEFQPIKQVKWKEIPGYPMARKSYPGQCAATIMPGTRLLPTQVGGFGRPFVDASGRALQSKIRRKLSQSREFSGQRILLIDCSFRPEMLFSNSLGIKDDVKVALQHDKNHVFSYIVLCQTTIESDDRLFMGHAYSAPWATDPQTPLVTSILAATKATGGVHRVVF